MIPGDEEDPTLWSDGASNHIRENGDQKLNRSQCSTVEKCTLPQNGRLHTKEQNKIAFEFQIANPYKGA